MNQNEHEYVEYLKEQNYLYAEQLEKFSDMIKEEFHEMTIKNAESIINQGYKGE